jgi:hypothetical protein
MAHFYGGAVPRFRFILGMLLAGLPRRFIPGNLCDLPPGGADEPVPDPVGQARPRQLGGLLDERLVLRGNSDEEGRRMAPR